MLIPLQSIIIKRRIRRELGDIEALVESFKKHGQLAPIIVNRKHELIAGFRRLQAARQLGWKSIEAVVIDRTSEPQKLELEIEENVQRLQLSPEEIADAMIRLKKLRTPGLLARIRAFFLRIFRAIFGPRGRRR